MNKKILTISLLIVFALTTLIYASVAETARAVVTVKELVARGEPQNKIRLGARVSDGKISYQTEPEFKLSFKVRDPGASEESPEIGVTYLGIMPDTLKNGRDVILEGDFDGSDFYASSLLTQCPSKYEPPKPGAKS